MSGIRLENITKQFEGSTAVKLSLEIADGEFLVLVGPSGCGKSTLLRLLAGLEEVSDGRIMLDGNDISGLSPRERNFSMIFQNYALFPHMTVEQNITFGMRMRNEPKDQHKARVDRVAGLLQLEPLLKRKPGKLSGGQRQRVAMARAIVRDPKLFLMDEPLSNLDARLRTEVRDGIMQLHQQLKTSTVYVTHDQMEAMTMADRIAVLDKGHLQQIGAPETLYAHPANLFVAGFIGTPSMNLFLLPCAAGVLTVENQPVRLPQTEHAQALDEVYLGIRPEHISDRPVEGESLQLQATLTYRELLGAEYLCHADTPLGKIRYVRKNQLRENSGDIPQPGDRITLYFSLHDLHLFSGQNQQNLHRENHHHA
ncbi:ABC transporter ATP-binding protein [Rahnella aceris]|uniref:ABC transporter ATP-binding protein n=1 Tax=Rahnella sp. (strain Y9602) TaxID=2703885 RepID=UPI001C27A30A|nr:ABC transporter ATP-binding protein [Rahnella aceris]MBU9841883.1 ABC transporter ATP-binding protein [Rahnella aceris]